MKKYIKPVLESVELKSEERMAGSYNLPSDPPSGGGRGHGMGHGEGHGGGRGKGHGKHGCG